MKFVLELSLNPGSSYADVREALTQVIVKTGVSCCKSGYCPSPGDGYQVAVVSATETVVVKGRWEIQPTKGDPHPHVGIGHCKICDHYGEDCTGERPRNLRFYITRSKAGHYHGSVWEQRDGKNHLRIAQTTVKHPDRHHAAFELTQIVTGKGYLTK